MPMISRADDYFNRGCGRCDRFDTPDCSTRKWITGLKALRKLCLDMGLEETVKWGHPTYTHVGRNIALINAFQTDFRISFMNPTLLNDSAGVLEKAGPNTQTAGLIRFTSARQLNALKPTIQAYLQQLIDHAEAGTKPPKVEKSPELMPEELITALEQDPELADAFHTLTPGRQRSYLIKLNQAKKAETRKARIESFRGRILAGKGAQER